MARGASRPTLKGFPEQRQGVSQPPHLRVEMPGVVERGQEPFEDGRVERASVVRREHGVAAHIAQEGEELVDGQLPAGHVHRLPSQEQPVSRLQETIFLSGLQNKVTEHNQHIFLIFSPPKCRNM